MRIDFVIISFVVCKKINEKKNARKKKKAFEGKTKII